MAEQQVASTMLVVQEGIQFIALGIDGQARLFQVHGTPTGPEVRPVVMG